MAKAASKGTKIMIGGIILLGIYLLTKDKKPDTGTVPQLPPPINPADRPKSDVSIPRPAGAPVYLPKSDVFIPQIPTGVPIYQPKLDILIPKIPTGVPIYQPKSDVFIPQIPTGVPIYMPKSDVFIPKTGNTGIVYNQFQADYKNDIPLKNWGSGEERILGW